MRTIYVGDTVYQKTETGFISFDVAEVIDQTTIKAIVNGQENRISDFLTLSEVYRIHGEDAFVNGLENASELEVPEVATEPNTFEHTLTQDDFDANAPDLAEAGLKVGDVIEVTGDETAPITQITVEPEPERGITITNVNDFDNGTVPEITVTEEAFEESAPNADDAAEVAMAKSEDPVVAPVEETLPAKAPATKKASTKKKK